MAPQKQTDIDLDRVLQALIGHMTVAVSGERLARDLGVSHSKVVRLVDRLRAEGVEILGEAFSGFRLMRLPDVLLPGLLYARLHHGRFGRRIHHLYEIDSTNSFAFGLIGEADVAHGTLVLAERQTAGRGRRGRTWISPPGVGLYLSIVLKPQISCVLAPLLTLGAAVAAHDSIERITGLDVDVKWPNDLLIGRRKVAGVLSELRAELDRVDALVMGLGINVNHETMPPEIGDIATSLRIEAGREHSRTELLLDFLATFEKLYAEFLEQGPEAVVGRWSASSSFAAGRRLEISEGGRRVRGTSEGLNPLGALRVRRADGEIEEVYTGDVVSWE